MSKKIFHIQTGEFDKITTNPLRHQIILRIYKNQRLGYDFLSHFDREDMYAPESYTTVGGMIMNHLQRIPSTGDVIGWNGFLLEVVDMDNTRVDKIAVSLE